MKTAAGPGVPRALHSQLGNPGRRQASLQQAAGQGGDEMTPDLEGSGRAAGGGSSCAENRTGPRGSDRPAQPRRRRWALQVGAGLGERCRDHAATPRRVHAQAEHPRYPAAIRPRKNRSQP